MILMYICICNAITDRQINEAIANGASTIADLQLQLGVATDCGTCLESALELLPPPAKNHSLYALEIARVKRPSSDEWVTL